MRNPRFVVQRHASRTPHYDFRLECDGVFKSWAVPKGISNQIGERRLAIQVDDHSLEFGDFEGQIPAGEYGAGNLEIWDRGTYVVVKWSDDEILVRLSGNRLAGNYAIVRFLHGGERAWLVFRQRENNKTMDSDSETTHTARKCGPVGDD